MIPEIIYDNKNTWINNITYDSELNLGYIKFKQNECFVYNTESLNAADDVLIDYNKNDELFGIEIINWEILKGDKEMSINEYITYNEENKTCEIKIRDTDIVKNTKISDNIDVYYDKDENIVSLVLSELEGSPFL